MVKYRFIYPLGILNVVMDMIMAYGLGLKCMSDLGFNELGVIC